MLKRVNLHDIDSSILNIIDYQYRIDLSHCLP